MTPARAALLAAIPLAVACHGSGGAEAAPGDEGEAAGDGDGEGNDPVPAASTPSAPDGRPAGARLLDEARRMVGVARATSYTHHTSIDETKGTYDVDCSGFVDYALSRASPSTLAGIPKAPKHARPLAEDYVKAIQAGAPSIELVSSIRALAPGDLIAWSRPEDSRSTNTGHVMIVDGAPRVLEGVRGYAVPILDSTARRHGEGDSRPAKTSGIGRGTIVLLVDGSGAPTAFRWSEAKSAGTHATTIVFGRPE